MKNTIYLIKLALIAFGSFGAGLIVGEILKYVIG